MTRVSRRRRWSAHALAVTAAALLTLAGCAGGKARIKEVRQPVRTVQVGFADGRALCPGDTAPYMVTIALEDGTSLRTAGAGRGQLSWDALEVRAEGAQLLQGHLVHVPQDGVTLLQTPPTLILSVKGQPDELTARVPLRFDCPLTLSASGRDGRHGAAGEHGGHGEHAESLHVELAANGNNPYGVPLAEVTARRGASAFTHHLIDLHQGQLILSARGGHGGNGGDTRTYRDSRGNYVQVAGALPGMGGNGGNGGAVTAALGEGTAGLWDRSRVDNRGGAPGRRGHFTGASTRQGLLIDAVGELAATAVNLVAPPQAGQDGPPADARQGLVVAWAQRGERPAAEPALSPAVTARAAAIAAAEQNESIPEGARLAKHPFTWLSGAGLVVGGVAPVVIILAAAVGVVIGGALIASSLQSGAASDDLAAGLHTPFLCPLMVFPLWGFPLLCCTVAQAPTGCCSVVGVFKGLRPYWHYSLGHGWDEDALDSTEVTPARTR